MYDTDPLVIFTLDDSRYALPLSSVERVLRLVEVRPLPKAPQIGIGIINMNGKIVPVLDIRARFRLPKRELRLGDQLIIARTSIRTVAIVVDEALGVVECMPHDAVAPGEIIPGVEYVTGVLKLTEGMLFIHNLDEFLSIEENQALESAIGGEENLD